LGHIRLPAHGLILTLQSPYFKKSLYGDFVEGRTKEFFYNEHLHAHWRVIEYMYIGTYSDDIVELGGIQCDANNGVDDDKLMRPVRLYSLADYFCIDGLKKYALGRLQTLLIQTGEGFTDCVRGIYRLHAGPGNEMRALAVGVAHRHLRELMKKDRFRDLVHDGGDFTVELFAKVAF
ncbi:BTB/POZ domain-containing protein, partial [Corynascus similis CBS 632.67]